MVSFISAFYHVYVLSSLFQPGTTLDITFFFIQQVQHKLDTHKAQIQTRRPTDIKHEVALTLQNKVNPGVIFQSIIDIAILLLRIFVLLCILLAISIVEIAQISRQSISQPINNKLNSMKTSKNDTVSSSISSAAVAAAAPTSKKLEDSPRLLPTPPSEKCDSVHLPMNCHAPIMEGNDDDTTVTPAPSEPTPPDLKVESKQQQTMPILIDTNYANPDNDDENMHHQKAASFKSQPDRLPNDLAASTSFADTEDVAHNDGTTTSTAAAPSESESEPESNSGPILPLLDNDSPIEAITVQNQQPPLSSSISQQKDCDKLPVNEPTPVVSEMPDHAPKPSPSSSTHDIKTSDTNIHDDEKPLLPPVPHLPPPLTPSASLSSSLSTLAHTHSNNNNSQQEKTAAPSHQRGQQQQHEQQQQQQQQQQEQFDQDHHTTSRLHQVYLEKLQQPMIDPIAPLPRPYSSYSTRTHHSETTAATTSNSPPLPQPQPQGSSLSMKLNKLKKPGRRISQLFKKKSNKNKADL